MERYAMVKREVGVAVIVAGKIHDTRLASRKIDKECADMVAFGRQRLTDPYYLSKALEGRCEDIRWCLSYNQGCIERLRFVFKPATFSINPECGEE